MDRACNSDPAVCSQPTAGATLGLVSVVIFPPPQDRHHFGVVLGPVRAACILLVLWPWFEGDLAKTFREGEGM